MGLRPAREFILGFICCALLVACAAAFPYRTYELDPSAKNLRGDKPEHDLPLSVCDPTQASKYPCMVVLTDEFFALKADYLKTKQELEDCQAGGPPTASK